MDDGGRCLLDVINDPQLLQSFLGNEQVVTNSPSSSSTISLTTTSVAVTKFNDLPSIISPATAVVSNIIAPTVPNNFSSKAITLTTPVTKNETVKARKSSHVANKSAPANNQPKLNSKFPPKQIISISSNSSQPLLQHSGSTNTITTTTDGIFLDPATKQPAALQTAINSRLIPLSISGANLVGTSTVVASPRSTSTALNNATAIRIPSSTAQGHTTLVPTQLQLGPRPMTVLPQQIILPGGLQVGHQPGSIPTQFVIAPPKPSNPTHHQPGPLLQIIQTSQGPQILQHPPAAVNCSIPSNNVQSVVQTTSTPSSSTTGKGSKGGSKSRSKSTSSQTKSQNAKNVPQSNNSKLVQQPPSKTGPTVTTFQPQNQILLGPGSNQPGIIAGPNGTFFLNNILQPTNVGSSPSFLIQGNGNQTPLQLAIRQPQPPQLIVNNVDQRKSPGPGAHHLVLNPAGSNQQPIVSQAGGHLFANSAIVRPPGNIIIRPQIINQPPPPPPPPPPTSASVSQPTSNATQQFIQLQTPNGPILLSLNVNPPTSSQAPPTQAAPQPQAIQIGNTLISLTANNSSVSPAASALTLSGNNHIPIIAHQQHNQNNATALAIQHHNAIPTAVSSSQFILGTTSGSQPINLPAPQVPSNKPNQSLMISPKSKNSSSESNKNRKPTKRLNLADLLKETGILTDVDSPPTSPQPPPPTSQVANSFIENCSSTHTNLAFDNNINTDSVLQQLPVPGSVVMVPSSGLNSNVLLAQNPDFSTSTTNAPPSTTQQLRISLGPDGTIVLLSPNSNPAMMQPSSMITQQNTSQIQQKSSNSQLSKGLDSSGLGSSQPSPDSTTPSIDATIGRGSPSILPTNASLLQTDENSAKMSVEPNIQQEIHNDSIGSSLSTSTTIKATTTTHSTEENSSNNPPSQQSEPITTNTSVNNLVQKSSSSCSTNVMPPPISSVCPTTILVPNTIRFVDENNQSVATIDRSNLSDLISRVELQIKNLSAIKQPSTQQKDLLFELMHLQKNLLLIHQQSLPPNQIPLLKTSVQAQQLLQLNQSSKTFFGSDSTPQVLDNVSITTTIPTTTTTTTTSSTTEGHLTKETKPESPAPKTQSASPTMVISTPPTQPTVTPVSQASPVKTSTSVDSKPIVTPEPNDKSTIASPIVLTPPQPQPPPVIIKQEKPKSNVLKAIQSQLHADQNTALHPDYRTPFRSRDDACKRLLRYHVFDQPIFSQKQIEKFDKLYEKISQNLLYKGKLLYDKFRYLSLKQSMKETPSCEDVMVNRMMLDEETASLKTDKELVASGGNLPPLPESWLQQDSGTLKRKIEDEDMNECPSKLDMNPYLIPGNDETSFHSKDAPPDLNDLVSDMFDNEPPLDGVSQDQQSTSKLCDENQSVYDQNNDVVDEIMKQLNSSDNQHQNPDTEIAFDELESFDNVPLSQNNFIDSTSMSTSNNNSMNDDSSDLEALYSNIGPESWSSNQQSSSHLISSGSTMNSSSRHHGNLMGPPSPTSCWTSKFGNVNETEAAVAVQSIIDDSAATLDHHDDNIDFSSIVDSSEHIMNHEQHLSFEVNNESSNIATENNDIATDIQMHCAIESIIDNPVYSGNSHSSYQQQNHVNHSSNDYGQSTANNSLSYRQEYGGEHLDGSMKIHQHMNYNQSSMMSNHHMNNLFAATSSSMTTVDPMLDEAVKSIL